MDLAEFTTFGIGGPAGQFVEATTTHELIDAVQAADDSGKPLFVLSGGSNVLVGDDGFPGVVVRVANKGVHADQAGDELRVAVSAGEAMDDLVAWSVDSGLAGLEALSGIPGLVGAAPVQNIGAYGAEIAQVVEAITVWDRRASQTKVLTAAECGFGYRTSILKSSRRNANVTGRYVVLSVLFSLEHSDLSTPIAYTELANALGVELSAKAPLKDVRDAVLELRRSKGMVVDPADPDSHSAGSFFTNPLLTAQDAQRLPLSAPRYPQPDGHVKTSAAWLIEHAGFTKGYGDGPAKLSSKHVLALTNQGGAAASDVVALAREVRAGVRTKFGITLEPEPVLVGVKL